MFSHRDASPLTFVELATADGMTITASGVNYIWMADGRSGLQPTTAASIVIGDKLATFNAITSSVSFSHVVRKTNGLQTGLYNPHTASGTIIVNGIGALTFTDTLPLYVFMHRLVTMPARLVHLAIKALGGPALAGGLNDAVLSAYFDTRAQLAGRVWLLISSK